MSVIYQVLFKILFTAWSFSWVAIADDLKLENLVANSSEAVCNASGECSLGIALPHSKILLACETPRASINWNRNNKYMFLVACDCECSSHDNTGWLVGISPGKGGGVIKKIELGKRFAIEALEREPPIIHDFFSGYEVCEKVDYFLLKKSVFVSLLKQPSGNGGMHYCFSPMYIYAEAGRFVAKRGDVSTRTYGVLERDENDVALKGEIFRVISEVAK